MRSLHADLATAQKSATRTPYVRLAFTRSGESSYTYTTADSPNLIVAVRYTPEAFNTYAIVILNNSALTLPDLEGYLLELGFGYNTASGNRYEQMSRLWVKKQRLISKGGDVNTLLYLEGTWGRLRNIHDLGWGGA